MNGRGSDGWPSHGEWQLGELLADPQRLFVLWCVNERLCRTSEDFQRAYGPDFPIQNLIAGLRHEGWLEEDSSALALSDRGKEAVGYLVDKGAADKALESHDSHQANLEGTEPKNVGHFPPAILVEAWGVSGRAIWRQIDAGMVFPDGINFYGHFGDIFANQALKAVHVALEEEGSPCYGYGLQFEVDPWNNGYFRRIGDVLAPGRGAIPYPSLHRMEPLQWLVPDLWTWPAVAVRQGAPTEALADPSLDPALRDFLSQVSWQLAVRLQDNETYVGYLKFIGVGGHMPSDRNVLRAAYFAKSHVAGLVAHRHIQSSPARQELKERLHSTAAKIASPESESLDARLALRHVADMLTSHLGAGWNRAACYWPVTADKLRCVWAQGGSGDWSWCNTVQFRLGEEVGDVQSLAESVQRIPYPLDDPYYLAAAGERPVEVIALRHKGNENILASLWRAGGDVRKLPVEHQAWDLSDRAAVHTSPVDQKSLTQEGPLAAEFNQQDPWVQQVQGDRPNAPIFASKNGRYFAVPWFSRRKLIASWVVDMAYWRTLGGQRDAPSLALTREILNALGPAMDRHRKRFSDE